MWKKSTFRWNRRGTARRPAGLCCSSVSQTSTTPRYQSLLHQRVTLLLNLHNYCSKMSTEKEKTKTHKLSLKGTLTPPLSNWRLQAKKCNNWHERKNKIGSSKLVAEFVRYNHVLKQGSQLAKDEEEKAREKKNPISFFPSIFLNFFKFLFIFNKRKGHSWHWGGREISSLNTQSILSCKYLHPSTRFFFFFSQDLKTLRPVHASCYLERRGEVGKTDMSWVRDITGFSEAYTPQRTFQRNILLS